MNPIRFREATKDDLPVLLELYAQLDFHGETVDLEEAGAIYRKICAYPDYHIYFAEQNESVVGTLCVIMIDNIAARGRRSAMIESVVVRADHRASGTGKKMLQFAMNEAARMGAYKIALYTGSPNDYVHRFYEALGFERHGTSYRLDVREIAA